MSESDKLSKIKSSVFSRGLSIAKMTLNTSAGLAAHSIGTLLSNSETKDAKWKDFLQNQAAGLSEELGKLKGSLMKAGQMLSMYGEHFLPPEANQFLKNLQSNSQAIKWEVIEKIIQERMSPEQLAQLEIDPEPIGTASLGQVHRAQVKATGEWIALKVQYPGVDKAIDSDLKALRQFLSLSKLLPKDVNLDPLFAEVRSMLSQEIDYDKEIAHTKSYAARLQGDERYVVPQIKDEFCAPKIIATSWEKGLSPDDPMVKQLSQQRRNQLGLNFLNLYFIELFQWGIVQTDPHLGNYKVRLNPEGKDQLVLLDFGAVRDYPQEFLQPYYRMIKSLERNDLEGLRQAAMDLKFLYEADAPKLKQSFEDFCLMTMEPFLDPKDIRANKNFMADSGNYDFKNSDLPQRATKKGFEIMQNFKLRAPPSEILFLDRKTGGVFIFLRVLETNLRGRESLMQFLQKL